MPGGASLGQHLDWPDPGRVVVFTGEAATSGLSSSVPGRTGSRGLTSREEAIDLLSSGSSRSAARPLRTQAAPRGPPPLQAAEAATQAARAAAGRAEAAASAATDAVRLARGPPFRESWREAADGVAEGVDGTVYAASVSRQQQRLEVAWRQMESDQQLLAQRLRGGLRRAWDAYRVIPPADGELSSDMVMLRQDTHKDFLNLKRDLSQVRMEQGKLKVILEEFVGPLKGRQPSLFPQAKIPDFLGADGSQGRAVSYPETALDFLSIGVGATPAEPTIGREA